MTELNIDNESAILTKYNLNPNELFVIKCILMVQEGTDKYLKNYLQISEEVRGNFRSILSSLKNKHLILSTFKIPKEGTVLDVNAIPFSKSFLQNYYRSSFQLGKELFEEYPQFGNINGKIVSLRGVASKFDSLEDAYRIYGKTIHYKENVHKEIISLVKWAKENEILNQSLASFIINQGWLDLKALKDGKIANYNMNAVTLL